MPRSLLIWFPSVLIGFVCAVSAEEPFGVALTRPDSLVGWEYGGEPPTGWSIAQSRLSGNGRSSRLLSGFCFGDVELRFQWSVAEGAAWQVRFPESPRGEGLTLLLRCGSGCGELRNGGSVIAAGKAISQERKPHSATICRAGPSISVSVDGREVARADLANGATRRFGLGLALAGGEGWLADLRAQEPPGEPIFNGKDLDGWWTPGNQSAWAAQEGVLVLRGENGNYLRTKKERGNFNLSLDYRMPNGGNSGIGIRTPAAGWPSGDGMELQLMDVPLTAPLDKHAAMAIYGNVPPLSRADRPREWNRVVVKADGRMISAWVNGELVQHCNTLNHPELKYRHLAGWIGFQDHGAKIEVRNLRVREASPGAGLAAWQRPAAASAATVLLDRLMNSERLSLRDEIRSGAVTARVPGSPFGEVVLAELTGPGAVVRIARTGDDGRLAFYFDGEPKPRIQCRPADLVKSLPHVTEDLNPVLTCLTYQKGLRIVLRDTKKRRSDSPGPPAGEAPGLKAPPSLSYRIDYVALSPGLPVRTFATPEGGLPRDWLSAVGYRRDQCGWGGHRENEPMPRHTATGKTLPPGKSVPMIDVPGPGVALWVKLLADKRVLENDDLWLEAAVDGESRPAVACPVRFWFPGLVGQGNYPNFVLVDRNGPTNLLAMPFSRGIKFSLANHGAKPIRGVGLTVSVDDAAPAANRMRLRAIYQPADAPQPFVRQGGPGRWVGIVCRSRSGNPPGVESLEIDGRQAPGWAAVDADLFLGQRGDFRSCAAGRHGRLAWRYLLTEAVDFQESFLLRARPVDDSAVDRLAVFYTSGGTP